MAKRTSELPSAGTGSDSDLYAISQGPQSFKQTRGQLRIAILSAWQTFIRTFLAAADAAAALAAIGAAARGANSDITSITGLTTALAKSQGGTGRTALSAVIDSLLAAADAAAARSAIGAANASTVALKGANSDITSLTGLTTPLSVGQGGSGVATTALAAALWAAVKLPWTSYTPTITATSGTFTSVTSVTGSYMVADGICHFRARFTVTTKGTGTNAVVSLPFPALAGSADWQIPATERAVNGKAGFAYITAGLLTATLIAADTTDLASGNGAVLNVSGSYPIA